MATLALVDDHTLLRNSLADYIKKIGHDVVLQASNGEEFIDNLQPNNLPQIVLLDINMPVKDGYETAQWLKVNYPKIRILALSMYNDEHTIIRMLMCGANGYILKESTPDELRSAIDALITKGYHESAMVSRAMIRSMNGDIDTGLSDHEQAFLKLACSELTYKEIAEQMNTCARNVNFYRESLFEKLGLQSRVGLVMYAIKNKYVDV